MSQTTSTPPGFCITGPELIRGERPARPMILMKREQLHCASSGRKTRLRAE